MKKPVALLLTLAMALSCGILASACSFDEEPAEGETVTVSSLDENGETVQKEVPLNPQRVATLDYAVMDIMDYLGVGDRIVASCEGTIEYLSDYWDAMESGSIANLGTLKSYSLEELMYSEPDIIFISGRQSSDYANFEEIAPVVYLSVDGDNYYSDILSNVDTVAKIFGISESDVDEKLSQSGYEERIAAINETYNGASCLIMMYTTSPTVTNSNCYLIDHELGFENLYNSYMAGTSETHGSSISWESILELNPDYLFVLNRGYITSGTGNDAVASDLAAQASTIGYTGKIIVLANPDAWYTASGGIQALGTMISDIETGLGMTD